jgi:hypothetical protein
MARKFRTSRSGHRTRGSLFKLAASFARRGDYASAAAGEAGCSRTAPGLVRGAGGPAELIRGSRGYPRRAPVRLASAHHTVVALRRASTHETPTKIHTIVVVLLVASLVVGLVPLERGWSSSGGHQAGTGPPFDPASPKGQDLIYQATTAEGGVRAASSTLYILQFNQTGAPNGSTWWVNLSGEPSLVAPASNSSVSMAVANGTYNFTVGLSVAFWTVAPASNGSAVVNGSDVNVTLTFVPVPTFRSQFNQTGVPTGSEWYVNLSNAEGSWNLTGSGSQRNVSILLPNGSVNWTAAIDRSGWSVSPDSGTVAIKGLPVFVNILFSPPTFLVQFNQSGLPAATTWWVNFTGGPSLKGTDGSPHLSTTFSAGTYAWNASTNRSDGTLRPGLGTVTVGSAPVYVDLVFAPLPFYPVQFRETGVPLSATWWVNISHGPNLGAKGSSSALSLDLPNGTYDWASAITLANWSSIPPAGSLTVAGASVSVSLAFAAEQGSLVFEESSLPPGEVWYVNLTSGLNLTGTGSSLSTMLPYGSYTYRIASSNSSWTPLPISGQALVSASPTTVPVGFLLVLYAVEVTPILFGGGSPTWRVQIGTTVVGSGPPATVHTNLTNGSYSFSVSVSVGFTATPSAGSFKVHGGPQFVDVVISKNAGSHAASGLFGIGNAGYALLGGAVAAVVLVGVWVVYRWRKEPPHRLPEKEPAGDLPSRPPD